MNLGAHVVVAAALSDRPLVRLGAALPDVATIGGFRMVPAASPGPVADGIALHHRTDAVFHSHRWFIERQQAVGSALRAAGVRRGAARASAHVGVELLLDGELFKSGTGNDRVDAVGEALAHARPPEPLAPLVADPDRPAWLAHLAGLPRWRPPHHFADPAAVARRLHGILSSRPRLAMRADEIPAVEAALTEIQPSIAGTAERFLVDLIEQVAHRAGDRPENGAARTAGGPPFSIQ